MNEICNIPSKNETKFNTYMGHLILCCIINKKDRTYIGGRSKDLEMYSITGPPSKTTRCSTRGGALNEVHGSKR